MFYDIFGLEKPTSEKSGIRIGRESLSVVLKHSDTVCLSMSLQCAKLVKPMLCTISIPYTNLVNLQEINICNQQEIT